MTSRNFLIMAGGTGGHVYPALGFAEMARKKGHKVSWLGTAAGLEARVVPESQIELNLIDIEGVRGKGIKSLLLAPLKILRAVSQARSVIKKLKPDLVIGFGGYSAGPGGVASKLAGIPLVIHEQNAVAGTTNKLLSKIARVCLCAFEGALPNSETVGNPVRAEILELDEYSLTSTDLESRNLLVIGGSLGARFLNESVPVAIASMDSEKRPAIRHQAGPKLIKEAIDSYEKAGVDAEVTAYIEDMASAYKWADLVVCRAGAMTVSELSIVGVASLLVPFPFAIDDHQTANARWLVDAGAAEMYQQSEDDLDVFTSRMVRLLESKKLLADMAVKARSRGFRDSTDRIVGICENLCEGVAHVA